jgi:hypothetical protein
MKIKLHDVEVSEVMSELMEENCPGIVWLKVEMGPPPLGSHEEEHMRKVYATIEGMAAVTRETRKVSR